MHVDPLLPAAWLLTLAVHSTVLLGTVWVTARIWRRPLAEEALYRAAVFGCLVTATLAHVAGFGAATPWHLGLAEVATSAGAVEQLGAIVPGPVPEEPPAAGWAGPSGLELALIAYVAVAAALLAWRGWTWWRADSVLSGRRELFDPRLLAAVARLRAAAGMHRPVRVSEHPGLRSPIAFGLLDAEICLPAMAVRELDPVRQECVLAHEIAHLRGRDPWWQLGVEVVTCLLFFQPLLYVARRRLRDLAEFRCDAHAVRQTGDRSAMAHTLIDVAGWLAPEPAAPHAVGMAHRCSPLRERIGLILDGHGRDPGRRDALLGGLLWLLIGAVGYGLPAVHWDAAPAAQSEVQAQLSRLEQQIATLHEHLAATWRRLDGRERPDLAAVLGAIESQLQRVTERHRALCREAAARAADTTDRAQSIPHPDQSTRPK